ncbi:MAG: protein kinase [Acidobacteriota bacterium]|nr:protein kinase [Acidobacteriota bacterium]
MTLPARTRLGPYEILAQIGAGGMGEVYRAKDTRLGRTVAIKVLPSQQSKSEEVRQRFEREAKTISQLSHPHICALYDLGNQDGVAYLVLEFLEGESLAERLAKGPLPLDQALRFGIQIADALEAAHRLGIVHRDLKPGNVMITKSGAKVLDFGLAKLREEEPQPAASRLSALATQNAPLTSAGTILGTVQYMPPEQLEGKTTDARADVFALGATLYEMVTGKKAFSGGSQAALISAILNTEPPPLSSTQPMSPPALDRLIRTCLAKDPELRWQSARDVGLQLAAVADGVETAPAQPAKVSRRLSLWAATAAGVLVAAALFLRPRAPERAAGSTVRFSLSPPPGVGFAGSIEHSCIALSPDGRQFAFVGLETGGRGRVWIRGLADLEARPLVGTEGANSIFWSPDGSSIGFFTPRGLARVGLSGGAPVPICDLVGGIGRSGSWGAGGQILFASVAGDGIYRVSADGGKPQPVIRADPAHGLGGVIWPSFLPDGQRFLYLNFTPREMTLMLSRTGEPPRAIAPLRSRVEFLDPGYLVFAREGALLAQRFDLTAGRLTGPTIPIAPEVNYFQSTASAAFTASRSGTLAFHSSADELRLTWFDRTGRPLGPLGRSGKYLDVAIGPDGKRILFSRARKAIGTFDIWMLDVARGTETPVTTNPQTSEFGGVWLPDGKSIIYTVGGDGTSAPRLYSRQLASGEERELLPAGGWGFQRATGLSPDGHVLAFDEQSAAGSSEAWTMRLGGDSRPARFFSPGTPAASVRLSPDGRAAAFLSSESGTLEAYVIPLGSPGEKTRVSTKGAYLLRFGRNGKELFYVSPEDEVVSVPIRTAPSLEPGEPRPLFRLAAGRGWSAFDVAPDGRFLAVVQEVSGSAQPATIIVNWAAELSQK